MHQMLSIMEKKKARQEDRTCRRMAQAHSATKCQSHLEIMRNRRGENKRKGHWIENDKDHSRRGKINEASHWRSLAMNEGELEQ